MISTETVAAAMTARTSESPLAIVDLALPHDVAPEVGDLPGVSLIPLKSLAQSVHNGTAHADVAAVKAIVAEEVAAYTAAREAARVAPTVVALRTMATSVVAAELERLFGRVDDLTDRAARRDRAGDPPGRGQAAARADRAGQGARRALAGRDVRRGAR